MTELSASLLHMSLQESVDDAPASHDGLQQEKMVSRFIVLLYLLFCFIYALVAGSALVAGIASCLKKK